MATVTGDTLPPLLMQRLRATAGPRTLDPGPRNTDPAPRTPDPGPHGLTAVPICTVDPDGFPHPAMLSYAELAADDERSMRAAVYGSSSTARHLRQRGTIALLFVDAEGTYYVKARATGSDTPHPATPGVAVFPLEVVAVLADAVDPSREPEAAITSGIRFTRTTSGTRL